SFSILMARYKGYLEQAIQGIASISSLKANDRILVAEGCTHHRQCGDIGTQKIPHWLQEMTKLPLRFETSSGPNFPENLTPYALIILCGGCMLTEAEVARRIQSAQNQKIPVLNYGLLIAKTQGILERSLQIFSQEGGTCAK
ncbi:MAG: [Desulfovibrio sp.]|nr:[FeFe] hydrogenase H-cluster maturation GTPase HydF [Desulfovibrio sp.]